MDPENGSRVQPSPELWLLGTVRSFWTCLRDPLEKRQRLQTWRKESFMSQMHVTDVGQKLPKWQGARAMLGWPSPCPLIGGPGHCRNIVSSAHCDHSARVTQRALCLHFRYGAERVFFSQCVGPGQGFPLSPVLLLGSVGRISRCTQNLRGLRIDVVLLASFKQAAYRAYLRP